MTHDSFLFTEVGLLVLFQAKFTVAQGGTVFHVLCGQADEFRGTLAAQGHGEVPVLARNSHP